jgi:hypothetical protein
MNNGLPYLLEAIFGKKNLASVSLDELYEVINEFPSFNAGHFLLLKKLKEENNVGFEKESMRTALYFHNAFWLQTLLDERNHEWKEESKTFLKREDEEEPDSFMPAFEMNAIEDNFTGEQISPSEDELNKEVEEILDEETEYRQVPEQTGIYEMEKDNQSRVTSFDDLISKYKIDTKDVFSDSPVEMNVNAVSEPLPELKEDPVHESNEDSIIETIHEAPVEHAEEMKPTSISESDIEMLQIPFEDSEFVRPESTEEIINEYGVFEEVIVRKTDIDMEAFDRPIESATGYNETEWLKLTKENIPEENGVNASEISPAENETIIENTIADEAPERTEDQDYEAFDRRGEFPEEEEIATEPEDISSNSVLFHSEEREKLNIKADFESNNAESIVFAPYHMIDYFASQGIKLVLEDQPLDNFGKQLKSFTDWLKVMKKLPPRTASENANEKEAERIRHFAAHSIEDRDILTESMAEVLAKQGMFENAIALYQKLSLIYPPKSAYFASRIEQLKASLP